MAEYYNKSVNQHKEKVLSKLLYFSKILKQRGLDHDNSKLKDPEKIGWEAIDKEPKYEYGSDEYFDKINRYKEVFDHHYTQNSHHPEHFKNPEHEMSLVDLLEMLCDWFSYKDYFTETEGITIIDQQCERFNFSNTIRDILLITFITFLADKDRSTDELLTNQSNKIADIKLINSSNFRKWKIDREKNLESEETRITNLLKDQVLDKKALMDFCIDAGIL